MTINQFHKRHLARNPPAPLSPNIETIRRNRFTLQAPCVRADWNWTGISGGHNVTVGTHSDRLVRIGLYDWQQLGLTAEGNQSVIYVLWQPPVLGLAITLSVNFGAGPVFVAGVADGLYTGIEPYQSPLLNFAPAGGTASIFLTGDWQP